jgi:hypothetical protein
MSEQKKTYRCELCRAPLSSDGKCPNEYWHVNTGHRKADTAASAEDKKSDGAKV